MNRNSLILFCDDGCLAGTGSEAGERCECLVADVQWVESYEAALSVRGRVPWEAYEDLQLLPSLAVWEVPAGAVVQMAFPALTRT